MKYKILHTHTDMLMCIDEGHLQMRVTARASSRAPLSHALKILRYMRLEDVLTYWCVSGGGAPADARDGARLLCRRVGPDVSRHLYLCAHALGPGARCSVYSLYWYKSTSTDAKGAAQPPRSRRSGLCRRCVTCFTATGMRLAAMSRERYSVYFDALLVQKYKY